MQTVTHNVRRQLGVARRAVTNAADLARHPDKLPRVGSEVVGAAQSLIRQAAVTDHARSPLWTERSLRRRFEVLRIPLDDTKRAAKVLGGSVNALFVAGAAAAAGAYHRAKGAEVEEGRAVPAAREREPDPLPLLLWAREVPRDPVVGGAARPDDCNRDSVRRRDRLTARDVQARRHRAQVEQWRRIARTVATDDR